MKLKKINTVLTNILQQVLQKYPKVYKIVDAINKSGGKAILVGGAVRDLFLGVPVKDLDIEVYGIPLEELKDILKQFGHVNMVGKSFGVFRVKGLDIDWSLPRKDSSGRKPKVDVDAYMNFEDAFKRRDLTMNAMGIDLKTFELIDPFDGLIALKEKRLTTPDNNFFIQDPLRFFRIVQFMSRFDMHPDKELEQVAKDMDLTGVSKERIEQEFEKLLLKSKKPSQGIRWIKKIGRLNALFPELGALVGVKQNSKWHPEGDVFEHTMQSLDAAAQLDYATDREKLIILFAALCHDLGKATTTKIVDGQIKSIGHEQESVEIAKKLLKRLTTKKDIQKAVKKLVGSHMVPAQLVDQDSKPAAYKRLARRLAPEVTIQMLAKLAIADRRGRKKGNEPSTEKVHVIEEFKQRAQQARVEKKPEEPVLRGRDIMDIIKPGQLMGKLLNKAYEIQIEEGIKDKKELKKRILKLI